MKKQPTLESVRSILNHPNTRISWVCGVNDGKIERIARIAVQYPAKGHAERPLRVAVTDWGYLSDDGSPNHHVGVASGFGYDKLTAALDGATVGGNELGDHGVVGKMTLKDLCYSKGWEIIGDL